MGPEERVRELLAAGESRSRIARQLGIDRDTVRRYAAKVGYPSKARRASSVDWTAVRIFYEEGHTVEECKSRFGFSASSWEAAACRGDVVPRDPPTKGRPRGETREKVGALLVAGVRPAEVARRLGISKPTVTYHARKLGVPIRSRCAQRYDWDEIQHAYDGGLSVRECAQRFGFNLCSWHAAAERGAITPRPRKMPIDTLLVAGRRQTSRTHLKQRLLDEGLKENRCETCGIVEWRGRPLNMELHHVNGDGADNRLENLQLLCGNCHSQTDNWGGRGRKPASGRRRPSC
jgi:DNA-binding CsgD family transcriptional regulator